MQNFLLTYRPAKCRIKVKSAMDYITIIGSGVVMPDNAGENKGPHTEDTADIPKKKRSILSFLMEQKDTLLVGIIGAVLGSAIFGAIIIIFSFPFQTSELTKMAESQKDDTASIKENIEEIKEDIDSIQKSIVQESIERTKDISDSEEKMRDYIWQMIQLAYPTELNPTPTMTQAIKRCVATDNIPKNSGKDEIVATTLVAYNVFTNEKYTAQEIANHRVLLPYQDGTKKGYFYGQLSESGAWDGDCVINVYENGKLIFIKEATYDDGHLLRSRQVFSYFFNANQKVWAISNRTNSGDYSEGETCIYKWERDYIQRFESGKIAPKDIVSIDVFQSGISPNLFAYYNGRTSNGLFNDKTGSAYMVHFLKDGAVRLLYVGNFENGHFNDSTGNAWYIVREENTDYMFCKGIFKDDDPIKRTSVLPPPLSLDQIKEIIGDRAFHIQLRWGNLGTT